MYKHDMPPRKWSRSRVASGGGAHAQHSQAGLAMAVARTGRVRSARATGDDSSTHLAILAPRIVAADVFKLLRREVVRNVKLRTNLFGSLPLDHVGNSLARKIEKRLNV